MLIVLKKGGSFKNEGKLQKKLWKLLIDKDLKKKDLSELANLSSFTINKLNRGDNVNTDTLVKICEALDCQIEDIMEILSD